MFMFNTHVMPIAKLSLIAGTIHSTWARIIAPMLNAICLKTVKGLMTQLKNSYLVMLDVQWFVILLDAMGTHLNEDLQQYTTPSLLIY